MYSNLDYVFIPAHLVGCNLYCWRYKSIIVAKLITIYVVKLFYMSFVECSPHGRMFEMLI
jgi:hypothetical protein